MRKIILLIVLLAPSLCTAQGFRFDSQVSQEFLTSAISGATNVLTIPSSVQVAFCSFPANAVPCTNKATTYTSVTLSTSCLTSVQIVLVGTTTCVASPDAQQNWGVWVPAGAYAYTLTLPGGVNLGPYNITLGIPSGSNLANVNVGVLNKTIYADQQAGSDACAKINASFALLPTSGTGAGGIVDATAFQGDQTCAAGVVFAPLNSSVKLKLGNSRLVGNFSGAVVTCPATMACHIEGLGTNTNSNGEGSVIVHNFSTGNDGIDWRGQYGAIDNILILNGNATCSARCSSLLVDGSTATGAGSHNRFFNIRFAGPGSAVTNSVGIELLSATSSAFACCNDFQLMSFSPPGYADNWRLDTTNTQGSTDNWAYATYMSGGGNCINIQKGDVNGWLGGILSSCTTGINVASGPTANSFIARTESNTNNCNSSGTGGFFWLTQDANTCTISAGANGDSLLGTGNSGITPNQRLQGPLFLPFANGLVNFGGNAGVSIVSAGVVGIGNGGQGDVSGTLQDAITQSNAYRFNGVGNLFLSATAPTIAAAGCGGAAASIANVNGTAAFEVNVGTTPGSACTITMPAANHRWTCTATDFTTNSTSVFVQKQSPVASQTTTQIVITNFSDVAAATAFVASDIMGVSCHAD